MKVFFLFSLLLTLEANAASTLEKGMACLSAIRKANTEGSWLNQNTILFTANEKNRGFYVVSPNGKTSKYCRITGTGRYNREFKQTAYDYSVLGEKITITLNHPDKTQYAYPAKAEIGRQFPAAYCTDKIDAEVLTLVHGQIKETADLAFKEVENSLFHGGSFDQKTAAKILDAEACKSIENDEARMRIRNFVEMVRENEKITPELSSKAKST